MDAYTPDWKITMAAILFGLLMFGLAFNGLVSWLGSRKEGYVSLLVVAGVLITLGGAALLDWQAAAWVLICFAASGTPMIIGDIWRAQSARDKAARVQRLIEMARDNGDSEETTS
jgi:thiol:disulfide interchange protein